LRDLPHLAAGHAWYGAGESGRDVFRLIPAHLWHALGLGLGADASLSPARGSAR
jgi:hypothetical protein